MKAKTYIPALAPAVVVISIFFLAFLMFALKSIEGIDDALTFGHYAHFFGASVGVDVLQDTVVISIVLAVAAAVAGYPVAYIIARTNSPWLRKSLLLAVIVTFLSGTVTRGYAWLIILGYKGVINEFLITINIVSEPLALSYNKLSVFIGLLNFTVPFFILTLIGPIQKISPLFEEAAVDMGASRWQAFTKTTLPLSIPGVISGMSVTVALGISSFLFPLMLGGGNVLFMANYIYENMFSSYNVEYAAATATLLLIVSLAIVWLFMVMQKLGERQFGSNNAGN